jgi:hypothetical protein
VSDFTVLEDPLELRTVMTSYNLPPTRLTETLRQSCQMAKLSAKKSTFLMHFVEKMLLFNREVRYQIHSGSGLAGSGSEMIGSGS